MILKTMRGEKLFQALTAAGFRHFCGVPCSYLSGLSEWAAANARLIPACNEGDAVAICAGLELAGQRAVFYCQNSGLTNALSPLTSLLHTYGIPVLGFVSLRGDPDGMGDEPQHQLVGKITTRLLELCEIPWAFLPEGDNRLAAEFHNLELARQARKPFVFVVKPGQLSGRPTADPAIAASRRVAAQTEVASQDSTTTELRRADVLRQVIEQRTASTVVVATTGFIGRELAALDDAPGHFYMAGSMGCAASIGLGLAVARPELKVVILDGDGALLMRMGAAAALTMEQSANLLHVLLNNGMHESTGGQPTAAAGLNFLAWSQAMGYGFSAEVRTRGQLADSYRRANQVNALAFLHVPILPGNSVSLGRPRQSPFDLCDRFRTHVAGIGA